MTAPVLLVPGFTDRIKFGGVSVLVNDGTLGANGGLIINPYQAIDQRQANAGSLYINLTGPASLSAADGVTIELKPGQSFVVPPSCVVWVNAGTDGHAFTAVFSSLYVPPPPLPVSPAAGLPPLKPGDKGFFPPSAPTGMTKVIPSYLYQEYSDDDDLQGFVQAQNSAQQNYVDTFNALNLPIYIGPTVTGDLLDWVGTGLYGMKRPALSLGRNLQVGPLNTWGCAITQLMINDEAQEPQLPAINGLVFLTPYQIVHTTDDTYRRILTWHLFKGDGKHFNIRWLKRRVWRFLYGDNGTAPESRPDLAQQVIPGQRIEGATYPDIANTEQISISMGVNRNVNIRFKLGERTVTGGAMCNCFGLNGISVVAVGEPSEGVADPVAEVQPNDLITTYEQYPPLPYMLIFKEALVSGALETPAPWNFTCTIG